MHIGNLAAQTGVSRWGETSKEVKYDKTENIPISELENKGYDWVISEEKEIPGFIMMEGIDAFSGFSLELMRPVFLPKVFIHKRAFRLEYEDETRLEADARFRELEEEEFEEAEEDDNINVVENLEIEAKGIQMKSEL